MTIFKSVPSRFAPGERVFHKQWKKFYTVVETVEADDEGGDPDLIVRADDADPFDQLAADKAYRFESVPEYQATTDALVSIVSIASVALIFSVATATAALAYVGAL